MKQPLNDLVDDIFRAFRDDPEQIHSEGGLRQWLRGKGYKKSDIEAAIKLISPGIHAERPEDQRDFQTYRALTPFEAMKMTQEAQDALVRLSHMGLIDPVEREMVLERMNQYEGDVGLDELDYLVGSIICINRDYEFQQVIYTVLDGAGATYH